MAGDARVRHCALCSLNVYNFAEMTRGEIFDLLERSEGRVCARLYRRADGTLLTKNCPSRLQALRRRVSTLGSAALAALVGLASLATGCASDKSWLPRHRSRITVATVPSSHQGSQRAAFEGVVRDETGLPLPGVTVMLREHASQRTMTAVTDENGAFAISAVVAGTYRAELTLEPFLPVVIERFTMKPDEVTRATATLRLDQNATVTVGIVVEPPVNTGSSTTFSKELLDKLPIGN
jgi:hypothetical protein